MESCSSERRFSVAEVHVLLEGSGFGGAGSADCGRTHNAVGTIQDRLGIIDTPKEVGVLPRY